MADLPLEDQLTRLDDLGPTFLMGCPRSGTTFLVDAVARLPRVHAFSGVLLPDRLMHLLASDRLDDDAREDLLWVARDVLWKAVIARHFSRGEALIDTLRGQAGWTAVARRPRWALDGMRVVYKDPFAVFAAHRLAAHFGRARFVHIVRDGRDCADSLRRTYPDALSDEILQDPVLHREKGSEIGVARAWQGWYVPWWVPAGAEAEFTATGVADRYLWLWAAMVERGLALAAALGPTRVLEVRYERFVRQPQTVGHELSEFLATPAGPQYRGFLRRASTRSVGIHRQDAAVPAAGPGWDRARPLLERLGYLPEAAAC